MSAITGIGTAHGSVVSQLEILDYASERNCETNRQKQVLQRAFGLTGVASRSVVLGIGGTESFEQFYPVLDPSDTSGGPSTAERMELYRQTIAPLAARASRAAIADDDGRHDLITHLVTVSCTGFHAPGFDIALINDLGLRRDLARTHIGFMGCHGALNGLRVADHIVRADRSARVLLCAAEACSLHYQYGWERQHLVAASLFADGAAALIVRENSESTHQFGGSGSYVVPETLEAMTWTISDNGFVMTLSPEIPDIIASYLPNWMDSWLEKFELERGQIASWAVHPGGPKILSAVEGALELPVSALQCSRSIFAEFGNMSSPTVLFILERMRRSGNGLPCVMLGFGPGLTIEAALIH